MSGNKARTLGLLEAAGFPVPPFYVVDSALLERLNEDAVRQDLSHQFDEWSRQHSVDIVAVRSSAEGEDSAERSFAGQFATFLPVSGTVAFLDALDGVATKRQDSSYSADTLVVHAIVQQFVDAGVAGVCFSIDPVTGSDHVVVNAAKGIGKSVVDGGDVATYAVDRISTKVVAKYEPSSQYKVLNKRTCSMVAGVTLAIERLFGVPQDVEWAIGNGRLSVLQARPITAMKTLQVWDASNISESFPGIVSPLTFSIAKRGYTLAYSSQAYAAGLDWYRIESHHNTFNSMVAIFNGRMYYNLVSWYRFLGLFPANTKNQRFLDEQLQTLGRAVHLPHAVHPLSYRMRFWFRVARRVLLFERERERYWAHLDKGAVEYELLPGGSAQALMRKYQHLEENVVPHMGRSVDNDAFVMVYNGLLTNKLCTWLAEAEHVTRAGLSGIRDVVSVEQAKLLYGIAGGIKADEQLLTRLTDGDYVGLRQALANTDIAMQLDDYTSRFGHRFAEDQKVESVNPLLDDAGFFSLIRTYVQLDLQAVVRRLAAGERQLEENEMDVARRLTPHRRIVFRLLTNRLKYHLRVREHNRLLRGRVYAQCREIFRELGTRLADDGILDTESDIYFLEVDELHGYFFGSLPGGSLRELVDPRKRRYAEYEALSMPTRFVTTEAPYEESAALFDNEDGECESVLDNLVGTVSSPGAVTGTVTVMEHPVIPDEPFEVLVVSHTDPGWTPLIALAKGLVVEHGAMLSHAAIITRELGIPSIVGVDGATRRLRNGMKVTLNSASGAVEILDQ